MNKKLGRPAKGEHRKVVCSFTLSSGTVEQLNHLSKYHCLSRSHLVDLFIERECRAVINSILDYQRGGDELYEEMEEFLKNCP